MSTEKTFFRLEDSGKDTIKASVNGSGADLINLVAQAISANEDIRMVVEMALLSVIAHEESKREDDDQELIEMLSKMKIGVA